jgi:hypothetical protein
VLKTVISLRAFQLPVVFKAAMWIGIAMMPISIRTRGIRLSILKLIRILPQFLHMLEDRIFILFSFTAVPVYVVLSKCFIFTFG